MENFLTLVQIAEEMHVPLATVRRWRLNGQGPRAFRVGRHVRVRRADFDSWVAERLELDRNGAA